jgi:hypothetical protein
MELVVAALEDAGLAAGKKYSSGLSMKMVAPK